MALNLSKDPDDEEEEDDDDHDDCVDDKFSHGCDFPPIEYSPGESNRFDYF